MICITRYALWPVILSHLLVAVLSSPIDHPDRVRALAGAPPSPPFPMYAGYLTFELPHHILPNRTTHHNIFYVLCESIRVDPLDAPLVVWLNGGPGSSSLVGFALENGPFLLDPATDELRYNDLSWNQYANVLYLETPTRVGFSYSNRSIYNYDDTLTANITKAAIHAFMTRVHSRYRSRDFYITGESYAGVYIPYLSRSILYGMRDGTFANKRFKGIAMGNARIEYYSADVSRGMQMAAMGMLPHDDAEKIFELWRTLWNEYYGDVDWYLPDGYVEMLNSLPSEALYNLHLSCDEADSTEKYHIATPSEGVGCTMLKAIERYFNRADVQKSLNVGREVHWKYSSDVVFKGYRRPDDTTPLYSEIFDMIEDDFRILFYTGDMDLIIPAIHVSRGTTLIARKNELKEIEHASTYWSHLGDRGGAQTSYISIKKNITMDVLTVRGAGHLVPIDHPSRAFQILNNFIFSDFSSIDYSKKVHRKSVVVPELLPSVSPNQSLFTKLLLLVFLLF